MRNLMIAFVIFCSVPAFAGKMKEIHIMTQESVMDYLGFDENVIKFESFDFVQIEGVDLAVETIARSYYSVNEVPPTFKCVTTFAKSGDNYSVIKTKCVEIP
jgi:hypothetical protein